MAGDWEAAEVHPTRVLLFDADNKWPNLALMKLAAHHRARGHEVVLNAPLFGPFDRVHASCVFPKNRWRVESLPFHDVEAGGSGWDLKTVLPPDVERLQPDYSLYGINWSLGFTSRGCPRRCPWCIVPEKEGDIEPWASIYEFWDPRHRKIVLLDNNLLASPNWRETLEALERENLMVDFNQGLDIRLLTEENARLLARLHFKRLRFAFDQPSDEREVRRAIRTLNGATIPTSRLSFYVLTNFNTTLTQDLARVRILTSLGVNQVFVMIYGEADRLHRELQRWACHPYMRKYWTFEQWLKYRGVPLCRPLHEIGLAREMPG